MSIFARHGSTGFRANGSHQADGADARVCAARLRFARLIRCAVMCIVEINAIVFIPLNLGYKNNCFYTLVISNFMERREKILNWLISGIQQAPNSLTEMFYFDKK